MSLRGAAKQTRILRFARDRLHNLRFNGTYVDFYQRLLRPKYRARDDN